MISWTNTLKNFFPKAPYLSCQCCTSLASAKPSLISGQYSLSCSILSLLQALSVWRVNKTSRGFAQFPQNCWQEHSSAVSYALGWCFMITVSYCFSNYGVSMGLLDTFQDYFTFHIIFFCYLGTASSFTWTAEYWELFLFSSSVTE